jgi:hypothetical protein
LERIFDSNDVAVKSQKLIDDVDIAECNIGTKKTLNYVKLSSNLSRNQRARYDELLKEFTMCFPWTYEDLKTYDTTSSSIRFH